jgi:hypothetical protein
MVILPHQYTVAIGQIVQLQGRIFRVDDCRRDGKGNLLALDVECLNPEEQDEATQWEIHINDEDMLEVFSVH